jgi:membrane-bound lytic murein transglycosylase D
MTRFEVAIGMIVVAGLALVPACRTAPPSSSRAASPASGATAPKEPSPAPALPDPRGRVEDLLDAAREAASAGDSAGFDDCAAEVLRILADTPALGVGNGDRAPYRDEVLDELASLADQSEGDEEGTEGPPEPQPVPQERVAELNEKARLAKYDLPVVVNSEVTSLIDFYTGRYRDRFSVALERASHYLPFIRAELKQAKMPQDLAWLPLVESAFNPRARSRAKAQGLWQFMAGTARLYSLRCDSLVDERNDPYLATQAAVHHLSDLHGMFGSWELALAAYNCGAGHVQRAIKRAKGNTDFWTVRRSLRRETRNYVPALWAVVVVTKDPATYGLPTFEEKAACVARVPIEGALDIEVLAERAGIDTEELAGLNPALVRRLIPANGSYRLGVPCGQEEHVALTIAAIPESERVRRFLHVVKKGDTPGSLARKYGSTTDAILTANGLKNARSLRIGQTLIVPRGPVQPSERGTVQAAARRQPVAQNGAAAADPPPPPGKYVVRQGDNLFRIAKKFGLSTDLLQKLNNLSGTVIHPGDVLLLAR